ncbi:hypothetical protein MRX96_011763 [Rhipicephalus microplus]
MLLFKLALFSTGGDCGVRLRIFFVGPVASSDIHSRAVDCVFVGGFGSCDVGGISILACVEEEDSGWTLPSGLFGGYKVAFQKRHLVRSEYPPVSNLREYCCKPHVTLAQEMLELVIREVVPRHTFSMN